MTRDMVQPRKSGKVFPILAFSDKLKSFPHVLFPRWLQDANSPALSGKVGVKRAASVGGQQFAKVALPVCPKSRKFPQFWYFQGSPVSFHKSFLNSDISRWPRQECEVMAWRIPRKLLAWFGLENPEKIIVLKILRKLLFWLSLVFYLPHQQACSQFWDFVWQLFLWIYHNYICDLLMLRVTFRHDLYDKWYICIEQDVDASYRREWFH